MLRAGLVAAMAVVVVGAAAFALRPQGSSVEARPFPPAAAELRQLWTTAPRAVAPLPENVALGLGAPAHVSDARMAVDARFADGRPLGLWVWQRANGEVCDADSLGGAGCFTSFEGAPGNVGWSSIHGHHVLTGVVRDGTTGVDLRIFGEWRPAHVSHRGVYLDFGTRNLGSAITGYRYHLAGGATVTCDRWGAC